MAAYHGIGKDTVARIWRDHKLKPWQTKWVKVSNDHRLEEKLVDVVARTSTRRSGPRCSASTRRPSARPMTAPGRRCRWRGRAGTMTHDYRRHGTTDLFAALNVATGEVITDCRKGRTGADVVRFFELIDLHVLPHLDVHVVLDNLSAHTAPDVQKWLAHPERARWHLHLTPTSSSWLNLVEELTDRRLRRGTFTSVQALVEPSSPGSSTGTTTPNPSSARRTPRRSSRRSAAAGQPLHKVKTGEA